jgi:arsenate reductase
MIVYGIKNCDTVKKALNWLRDNNIDFEFHDFKKQGIQQDKLKQWADINGWESFFNKKGTTWKKLDSETQSETVNEQAAFKLMEEKTSVIKRPVIEKDDVLIFGFDIEIYQKRLL